MKGNNRSILVVAAITLVIAVMAFPVMAEDQAMVQEQVKLMAQVQQDTGMSAGEANAIRTQLNAALKAAGDGEPVRSMVRTSYEEGCQGECLGVVLSAMTRAMNQNYTAGTAQKLIRNEIRTCVRERSETGISSSEMAIRLQIRLEERILARVNQKQEAADTAAGMGDSGSRSGGGSKSSGSGGGRR